MYFAVQSQEEGKQTPFQSALPTNDVTYSLRHVEESWIHLLKAGGKLQYFNVSLIDILHKIRIYIPVSYTHLYQ